MDSIKPKTIARMVRRSLRGRPHSTVPAASDSLKYKRVADWVELSRQVPHDGMQQDIPCGDDSITDAGTHMER